MNRPYTYIDKKITALLGPTNTGKTHYAVERMLGHGSGIIGFPLRLLAREVYDRVIKIKPHTHVALITGEEKIIPEAAKYFICTVESMPLNRPVDFVAVDEIQLCADWQRGHVFTERLLNARGMRETMFMGSDTIQYLITQLLPDVKIIRRPRLSTLNYSNPLKLSRLPRRSAVVAFTTQDVYQIAELLRRLKGGTAIVMGGLSPKTRNAQAEMFQNGEVDYLVATDAIGMGLNLDIDQIYFSDTRKFDGTHHRALREDELAQIAGRAGRHMNHGFFSTLNGQAPNLEPMQIERITNHQFAPLKKIIWRNPERDFSSALALLKSLEIKPQNSLFRAAPMAIDLQILKSLTKDPKICTWADNPEATRLLWDICQIPDFQKLSFGTHLNMIKKILAFLSQQNGRISNQWIAKNVAHLDNVQGDLDTLSTRIAAIRIWTYIAHHRNWLDDHEHWTFQTHTIEDRLSNALHMRLTQRFVDKRTHMLMRELKQKGDLYVSIDKDQKIIVEGFEIGQVEGFSFHPNQTNMDQDAKTLKAAAEKALRTEMGQRANQLLTGPGENLSLSYSEGLSKAHILWKGENIATLIKGDQALRPKVGLLANNYLSSEDALKVQQHVEAWLLSYIGDQLKSLVLMDQELNHNAKPKDNEAALEGLARGVAFELLENLGIMDRTSIEEKLKAVSTEERKGLWRFKIKIGSTSIFIPFILKPEPTRLRLLLWALFNDISELPPRPEPGMVWVDVVPKVDPNFYRLCGYKVAGAKAVRVDMAERLADAVRPIGLKGQSFEVNPDTMGLVGLSGENFAKVMHMLGYQYRKHTIQKPVNSEDENAEKIEHISYSFVWQGLKKVEKPKYKKPVKGKKPNPKKPTVAKPEPKEFVPDPNSPFAALAALKAAMTKDTPKPKTKGKKAS